jgi:hypothetical protein
MAHKKETKKIKVRDLQPKKDAKGGVAGPDTHGVQGHSEKGHKIEGHIYLGSNRNK